MSWFVRLEQADERHTILVVAVMVLLVESILAGQAANTPVGILRPAFGGQDFRPPDIVLVAAIIARVTSPVRRIHVPRSAVIWFAFIVFYFAQVIVGLLGENGKVEVLFQGKALLYLVGGAIVGAGVSVNRAAEQLRKLAPVLAGVVLLALALKTAGIVWKIDTPVQRINGLGRLSNDTVSIIVVLGAAAMLTEVVRQRPRPLVTGSALILLLAPFAGSQRASYLVLAALAVSFGFVAAGSTWSRRANITGTEAGLLIAGLIGLVAIGFTLTPAPGVLTSQVEKSFFAEAEGRSASARFDLYSEAIVKIKERPVFGHGVGVKVTRQAELSKREVSAAAHNILFDMTMRTGFVGLAIFLAAIVTLVLRGIRRWREAEDSMLGAVMLSATLAVLAVMTKAMVEPALDKFRLSLTLGLAAGMILSGEVDTHGEPLSEPASVESAT